MSVNQLLLQKPLENFIDFIDKMNMRSVDLLPEHTAPIVSFHDPFVNLRGNDDIQKLLKIRFKVMDQLNYKVRDHMIDAPHMCAYVHWQGSFQKKPVGFILKHVPERSKIHGIMIVRFTDDYKIEAIEDYWGNVSAVPVVKYENLIRRM